MSIRKRLLNIGTLTINLYLMKSMIKIVYIVYIFIIHNTTCIYSSLSLDMSYNLHNNFCMTLHELCM